MRSTDEDQRSQKQNARRAPGRLGWRLAALLAVLVLALSGCGNMAPVYEPGTGAIVGGYYVVQRGDTLYSIAWRNNLDYRTLARWNRIEPPYTIYPGQRLRMSGPAASVASTAKKKPNTPPKTASAKQPATSKGSASTRKPPVRTASAAPAWRWPASGTVTRRFSANGHGKQGIELSGSLGAPVVAAAGGKVVYAGDGLRGYGNLIIVKHDARYLTAYGYNQTLLVKEGQTVQAGQRIATMGMGPSRKPALHFELRRDGKPVDPVAYLPKR